MAGAVERPAVLPSHAHIPAGLDDLIQGLAGAPAVVRQIQEEHVGALGHGHVHAVVVLPDVVTGVFAVALQHLKKFGDPLSALVGIGPDQGVHGQHVHLVVVGGVAVGGDPVAQIFVIDDVIAADQARQVEGLGGGVDGHGVLLGPVVDHECGGVLVAGIGDVGPDLVADHEALVGLKDLHGLLQLPALPHPPGGVVGGAEDGQMDVVGLQLGVHVLVVHAPHAVFILFQRAVHRGAAQVFHVGGEAHIGGAVKQNLVAGGGQGLHRAGDTAVDAVLVADILPFQIPEAVALGLPLDDLFVINIRSGKIAIKRVLGPLNDSGGDGGTGGKVHIGHPHRDGVEAVLGGVGLVAPHLVSDPLHRLGVFAAAVNDGCKVVFHNKTSSFSPHSRYRLGRAQSSPACGQPGHRAKPISFSG